MGLVLLTLMTLLPFPTQLWPVLAEIADVPHSVVRWAFSLPEMLAVIAMALGTVDLERLRGPVLSEDDLRQRVR